jgi:predicted dehydrogenase
MRNKKLNFAVIGCGNIGIRHLHELLQHKNANVIAVCDIDECKNPSSKIEGNYQFTTSFHSILKNANIDIVNICTPHYLHATMSIAALKKNKHVLVEKPMCIRYSDAKKMNAAATKYQKQLVVVKQNRYNFPVQELDKLLVKNKLGKIIEVHCSILWNRNEEYYASSDWRGKIATEAGALFTQGSHFVDLLVHWFGAIKSTHAVISTLNHSIEIEDSGNATVKFTNGTVGKINWSNNVFQKNYEGSITIFGEKGTVKIGGQYLNKIEYWDVSAIQQPIQKKIIDAQNQYQSGYQGSSSNHHLVFDDIINRILFNKKVNLVQGDEAAKSIDAIQKIYKSAKQLK